MIYSLSPKPTEILEALALYKYLTVSHLVKMGIRKSRSNLYKDISQLTKGRLPLVKKLNFGNDPKMGRLEQVLYLTAKGRDVLTNDLRYYPEDIRYPKTNNSFFNKDYWHRYNCITFLIRFNQWLNTNGYSLETLDMYFDHTGSNRGKGEVLRPKSRLDFHIGKEETFIIPDGNLITNQNGETKLYLMELHQSNKHTKRLLEQIYRHQMAMNDGAASAKYGFKKGYRVLFVFEMEGVKQATINRITELPDIAHYTDFFLFQSLEKLEQEFDTWENIKGEQVSL